MEQDKELRELTKSLRDYIRKNEPSAQIVVTANGAEVVQLVRGTGFIDEQDDEDTTPQDLVS